MKVQQILKGGLLLILFFGATASWAEVYKWKDAQGRVHFGDRPPETRQAENITEDTQKVNISTDLSSPKMIENLERGREQAKRQSYQAYKKQVNRQPSLDSRCRVAKARLDKMQGRVIFYDGKGKALKVSEKERQKMALKLEKDISQHCR